MFSSSLNLEGGTFGGGFVAVGGVLVFDFAGEVINSVLFFTNRVAH